MRIREIMEEFIEGEKVRHTEQTNLGLGVVVGYEGEETAVRFESDPDEVYFVPNENLELVETASAGASSAGNVAGLVGGLGAGDPKASIYYSKSKKSKKIPTIKRINR